MTDKIETAGSSNRRPFLRNHLMNANYHLKKEYITYSYVTPRPSIFPSVKDADAGRKWFTIFLTIKELHLEKYNSL
ncbi:hypothetical protein CLV59_105353 [Chitinophaga dinghuensis]|uniref:Uncharacterized protein n=1 Tax=Chitinophaga dinghuensis TaxID=1539050 RepID=A0A327VZA8_9BACT|nr:hypothetical protein CLV59_105353 [Chitinophaga dinghuensis]